MLIENQTYLSTREMLDWETKIRRMQDSHISIRTNDVSESGLQFRPDAELQRRHSAKSSRRKR